MWFCTLVSGGDVWNEPLTRLSCLLLVVSTTWLCWRVSSCWRSSAKSWQPSPSSNTMLLPPPHLNLPAVHPSASDRLRLNWALRVPVPVAQGQQSITTNLQYCWKPAWTGFTTPPPTLALLAPPHNKALSEHRHCPASRAIRGGKAAHPPQKNPLRLSSSPAKRW